MDLMAINSVAPVNPQGAAPWEDAGALAPPPAELVSKFEMLMQRNASAADADAQAAGGLNIDGAVQRVNGHIEHFQHVLEDALHMTESDMSMQEALAAQMQTTVQMTMMSINQQAYFGVLSSAKGTVSDLLKNQ